MLRWFDPVSLVYKNNIIYLQFRLEVGWGARTYCSKYAMYGSSEQLNSSDQWRAGEPRSLSHVETNFNTRETFAI